MPIVGTINMANSVFISNTAVTKGGAIFITGERSGMSLKIENSTFQSNLASTGGVFGFEVMKQAKITLIRNTYNNNSAALSKFVLIFQNCDFISIGGGIGTITESDIILRDSNSIGTCILFLSFEIIIKRNVSKLSRP